MKFIIFFILIIAKSKSCLHNDVKSTPNPPDFSTDTEFIPYIQEFEKFSKMDTSSVPIGFDSLNEGVAGVCYYSEISGVISTAYIKINRDYWNKYSQHKKINLIFHELGHCVLGRDHTKWQVPNECPSSFMNDFIISNYCLKKHYKKYIKEMFPSWEEKQ